MSIPLRCLAVLVPALVTFHSAAAQRKGAEKWRQDPYTRNEAAAIEKAGYVSLEPSGFGGFPTRQIEHVLGEKVQVIWLETAHFQIGVHLGTYKPSRDNRDEKRKIRKDLEELRKVLPRVKPRVGKLDPWLRAHLFAQRAEKVYADFQELLNVSDEDFPTPEQIEAGSTEMGQGPYLGMAQKFTIFLTDEKPTFGHFGQTFLQMTPGPTQRHYLVPHGSLFVGIATGALHYTFQNDTALHCLLAFNLIHNLTIAYKYYTHNLPWWWPDGLAQWYSRKISPRYPATVEKRRYELQPDRLWNWKPRVRGRVENRVNQPSTRLMRIFKHKDFDFIATMMAWSRVDYLMSLEGDGFRVFMDMMNGAIPMAGVSPTEAEVLARQDEALLAAWNMDMETLDVRWAAWVRKNYPSR